MSNVDPPLVISPMYRITQENSACQKINVEFVVLVTMTVDIHINVSLDMKITVSVLQR